MFEANTYEAILRRILARVSSSFDKREGSIIFDATAPSSFEMAVLYAALDYILDETFADTASRDHLLRRAAEFGVYPKPAGYAELLAMCSGVEVPTGTRFSLENTELNYVVLGPITVNPDDYNGIDFTEKQTYKVQCETIGTVGNRFFGNLLPIEHLPGLESAAMVALLIPGEDEQETEEFRQEYFESFLGRAFGGNRKDYINKVKTIKGVGAVRVFPVWNYGMEPDRFIPRKAVKDWYSAIINTLPSEVAAWLRAIYTAAEEPWFTVGGTVKVVILGAEYNPADPNWVPASPDLVQEVQEALDPDEYHGEGLGTAPIGHIVRVFGAGVTKIDINFEYTLRAGFSWAAVLQEAQDVIDAYFMELAMDWGMTGGERMEKEPVRIIVSQLANHLLDIPGIADILLPTLFINGSHENLTLHTDNIPVRGHVNGE